MSKRTLCNTNDPKEMDMWIKIAKAALKSSSYNANSGIATSFYFDFDESILGRRTAEGLFKVNATEIDEIQKKITKYISELENKLSLTFDNIAFIDKGNVGPVGIIGLMALVAISLKDKNCLIVRPRKRLINASVKGNFKKGNNVLILTDVVTSGSTIYQAANKIWQLGGSVPCALAWLDRNLGASENLAQYGVNLYSIVGPKDLSNTWTDLKKTLQKDKQKECFIDFGSYSSTSVWPSLN
ncbi:MAG: hypothetical protein HZC48_13665 [Nitrospirae bacterium]|nr:hypothetical protein [Nitrospirota bacterium]